MNGLYAIVDTKLLATRALDPVAFTKAILPARPSALQLRAKDLEARAILSLLRTLAPLCRQAHVPLVVNDRADLAALAGCDAVHIGQEDLPYALVHRIAPQLGVGMSTHDPEQLETALAFRPHYVTYGPVFATTSQATVEAVVGLEGLEAASKRAHAAGIPLVATGGITLAEAPRVAALADGAAVIGDLLPPGASLDSVTERAHAFQRALAHAARPLTVAVRA